MIMSLKTELTLNIDDNSRKSDKVDSATVEERELNINFTSNSGNDLTINYRCEVLH